jgi:ADP-dependent NAD(P)H-hydrate dehydratase
MSVLKITREFLLAHPLPEPEMEGDKRSRGRVLVVAGSVDIPGAALLAGLGSLRAGSGILQIATCRSNAAHLGVAMPEAMVIGCSETSGGGIDPESAAQLIKLGTEQITGEPLSRLFSVSEDANEPRPRCSIRHQQFGHFLFGRAMMR